MQKQGFGVTVFSALVLSACGQVPPPSAEPSSVKPLAAVEGVPALGGLPDTELRQDLTDARQLRADIAAGKVAAPVDEQGFALTLADLDALIQDLEAQIAAGPQLAPPIDGPDEAPEEGVGPPYATRVFLDIAADNSFERKHTYFATKYHRYNWGSDKCSVPERLRVGKIKFAMRLFSWPCIQHDFGYRNMARYPNLMTDKVRLRNKLWIDGQFKQHMYHRCDGRYAASTAARLACKATATVFHRMVVQNVKLGS